MNRTRLLALALLAAAPVLLSAQTAPRFAPARLARIDRFMQQCVDSGQIGGAVGLVLADGRVVYQHAVGWLDKEAGRRMTPDGLFRIGSQSKALRPVAIASLVEEGVLAVGDPVSRYIPAFAHTTVETKSDAGLVAKPAARPITIRDLLTHTAGISYGTDAPIAPLYAAKGLGPAAGRGWYTARKDEPVCTPIERLATFPFGARPGGPWGDGPHTGHLCRVAQRGAGSARDQPV